LAGKLRISSQHLLLPEACLEDNSNNQLLEQPVVCLEVLTPNNSSQAQEACLVHRNLPQHQLLAVFLVLDNNSQHSKMLADSLEPSQLMQILQVAYSATTPQLLTLDLGWLQQTNLLAGFSTIAPHSSNQQACSELPLKQLLQLVDYSVAMLGSKPKLNLPQEAFSETIRKISRLLEVCLGIMLLQLQPQADYSVVQLASQPSPQVVLCSVVYQHSQQQTTLVVAYSEPLPSLLQLQAEVFSEDKLKLQCSSNSQQSAE
jgi:hypothetical protein